MSELEQLLGQLRAAAELHGTDWLQSQIAISLRGVRQGPATPQHASAHARRSRPPERFSPESTPRAQCQLGSPVRDRSGPPAKQAPIPAGRGPGSNMRVSLTTCPGESP